MEYTNTILEEEEQINESDIKGVEDKFEFKFPEAVKNYYLQYNGGRLEKNRYIKNGNTYEFAYFFPIKYTEYSIEEILSIADENTGPRGLIAFGTDGGGDEFCFSIREGEEGKIYYIAHEFYSPQNPRKGVRCLANNLTEFINKMK